MRLPSDQREADLGPARTGRHPSWRCRVDCSSSSRGRSAVWTQIQPYPAAFEPVSMWWLSSSGALGSGAVVGHAVFVGQIVLDRRVGVLGVPSAGPPGSSPRAARRGRTKAPCRCDPCAGVRPFVGAQERVPLLGARARHRASRRCSVQILSAPVEAVSGAEAQVAAEALVDSSRAAAWPAMLVTKKLNLSSLLGSYRRRCRRATACRCRAAPLATRGARRYRRPALVPPAAALPAVAFEPLVPRRCQPDAGAAALAAAGLRPAPPCAALARRAAGGRRLRSRLAAGATREAQTPASAATSETAFSDQAANNR